MEMPDWKTLPIPLGLVIAIIVAYTWLDDKHVQASEYHSQQELRERQIEELRIEQLIMQRNQLQGNLFDLNVRLRDLDPPSLIIPDDERYRSRLEQQINDIENKIFILRTVRGFVPNGGQRKHSP